MDLVEQEILQQIVITDNERLPQEKINELYGCIMSDNPEEQEKLISAFNRITEEFLSRINKQMNLSLKPEDLKTKLYGTKDNFTTYGDVTGVVYYDFAIDNFVCCYEYFLNNKTNKAVLNGTKRIDRVVILNENNELLTPVYSVWKSKYAAYSGKTISMNDYFQFMDSWENGELVYCEYMTVKNIMKNIANPVL